MKINIRNGEIELSCISDFDLVQTFECGQCFRWDPDESGAYVGVALGCVAKIYHEGDRIIISGPIKDFETIWRSYFDLDRNYTEIRQRLCIDGFMHRATAYGEGIRILRQDKWEALCSFIISQNNNIPRIKTIINTLCREFGDVIDFEGKRFFAFPSAAKLASLEAEQLAPLRCGYRAEYIIRTAKMVANGNIDLDTLSQSTPEAARSALKKLHGVGDKVADCVMLFGLHMLDAFPLDVWMKRAVVQHYGPEFDPKIFSPYAGIAQQYIFNYVRSIG